MILSEVTQTQKDKNQTTKPKKKKPHMFSLYDTYEFMYEYVCVSVCVNTGRASRLAEGWGG